LDAGQGLLFLSPGATQLPFQNKKAGGQRKFWPRCYKKSNGTHRRGSVFSAFPHMAWGRYSGGDGAFARYFLGRMASAVPWMKALIFSTSPDCSLPLKSGMPRWLALF
jgi:hypothetical protein